MDRRSITEKLAANLRDAARGTDVHALTEAVGLTSDDLDSRLAGESELTVDELVKAGGFLRVRPSTFFEGVNA